MDIKDIQEQAYIRGLQEGRKQAVVELLPRLKDVELREGLTAEQVVEDLLYCSTEKPCKCCRRYPSSTTYVKCISRLLCDAAAMIKALLCEGAEKSVAACTGAQDTNVPANGVKKKLVEMLQDDNCPLFMVFGDKVDVLADCLITHGVTVQGAADNHDGCKWISVKDRLPQPETEVMILAQRKTYSFKGNVTTRHIMTTGMYEDGSKNTEDSGWHWETDGFDYDEELDAYIIPEGWWEYKHYNGDDEYNYPICDTVTHWMPRPQPPKGE